VVLVAHEANYYLDRFDGRLGLSYSRKRPLEGTFAERLRFVVTSALEAAARDWRKRRRWPIDFNSARIN
jgi:hypothetical protein